MKDSRIALELNSDRTALSLQEHFQKCWNCNYKPH